MFNPVIFDSDSLVSATAPTGAQLSAMSGSDSKVITLGWHLLQGQPLVFPVIVDFYRENVKSND